jgi:hypothetical protein
MKNHVGKILGIDFINKSFHEMVDALSERINNGIKTFVFSDGIGMIVDSKTIQKQILERVKGT